MGQNDPALGGPVAGNAGQLLHKKGIGQPVEAESLHTLLLVPPGNGQQPSYPRHGAMERRVKASDLWQVRIVTSERFDERDLAQQMIGIEGTEPVQFLNEFRGDDFRLCVARSSMNDPMTDRVDGSQGSVLSEPVKEVAHRTFVIWC